jgi:hypothetical protein
VRSRGIVASTLFLVGGVVHADVWAVQAMLGNDAFDGVLSHTDDNGFTNDLGLAMWRRRGELALGGSVLDRMITSKGIMRRTDLIELFARARWTLGPVTLEGRAGPTFAGDFGGQWVQSRWHRMTGTGPRDPRETPSIYMDDFRAGAVAGLRGEAGYGGAIRAYGTLDGQVASGETGVSFGEGAGGLRVGYRFGPVELGLFGELALGRYHVDDAELAMPGAYRPGWQVDRRVGALVGFERYRLSFEYHTNETSSGEAFSVFTLERR